MKKRLLFIIILSLTMVMLLSSCTELLATDADQVRINKWIGSFKSGNTVSLIFKEDVAIFRTKNNKQTTTLKGISAFDNEKMIIFDNETGEDYIFSYKVSGDSLSLTRDFDTITLKKHSKISLKK